MKTHTFLAIVAVVISLSENVARSSECDAVLKLVLEQTETKSESALASRSYDYYISEGFFKDFKDGKFKAGISIGKFGLDFGASDKEILEWQEKIESISKREFNATNSFYYLKTEGLETLANAWLACKLGALTVIAETVDGEDQRDATVTFKFNTQIGTTAEIYSYEAIGCEQIKRGFFRRAYKIAEGVRFPSTGVTAKIAKENGHPNPAIIVQTSIGTGIAFFKPWPAEPPDPPVKPMEPDEFIYSTRSVTKEIPAIGGWTNTNQDADMNTNFDDVVPAKCASRLTVNRNSEVILSVSYQCNEDGGDHTEFKGTRNFTVYSPPANSTVERIEARGGLTAELTGYTRGENHRRNNFPANQVRASHWNWLKFRVDTKHENDGPWVGVIGSVGCRVTFKSPNPEHAKWKIAIEQWKVAYAEWVRRVANYPTTTAMTK